MRILVIDPKHLPAEAARVLSGAGEPVLRDFSDPAARPAFLEAVPGAEALFVPLCQRIDREVMDAAPGLRFIATVTTGTDHIDLAHAAARGIDVLSLKNDTEFLRTIHSTAEHTWALLLALVRRIVPAADSVRDGRWDRDPFCGSELSLKRLGIVGLGRLGRIVAGYGQAFDMAVHGFDPYVEEGTWPDGVEQAGSLPDLLAVSDVLSIHVHLNEQTRGMIGEDELACLPTGAVVVNTSRGAVLDEAAVVAALEAGHLGGAAADVVIGEQEEGFESPLRRYARDHENVLVTPHIGGLTHEARSRTEIFMARKLARAIAGA